MLYTSIRPCQFSWWMLIFLKIRLTSAEIEMSKLSKVSYQKNSPCCSVFLWRSFCFLQVNQQKRVGMISTSNITYSEQIYKPFHWKPSHIVFLIKKRRSADSQYWTATLSNWKKQSPEVFYKSTVLKILQYSRENTCLKFSRTRILKNICARLFLNWFYLYVHYYRLLHKKQMFAVLGLLIKRCNNTLLCIIWLDRKYCRWHCATATHEPIQQIHFYVENIVRLVYSLFYCDHRIFNSTGGFFVFLFMVTGWETILICSATLLEWRCIYL